MYAKGHSFFTYMSDNADSLASCCRLRNEIQDNGFSYSLGAGGVRRFENRSSPSTSTAACNKPRAKDVTMWNISMKSSI